MRSGLLVVLTAVLAAACVQTAQTPTVAPSAEAARSLAAAENAWLARPAMTLHMTASSTGAVATDFQGTTVLGGDGHADLDYAGSFRGQAEHLHFAIDGTALRDDTPPKPFTMEAPAHAEANLRMVLFRLGLLHNLAMLTSGQPPDGLDDANAVVRQTQVALTTDGGRPCFHYDLMVGGQLMGQGMLWLDPATGLPAERQLTVHFPNGDMLVHETYTLVH